jgi:hypothetical protein
MKNAATDLYDFVARLLDDRVKPTLGPGYKPLPATFQTIKPFTSPSGT